MQASARDAPKQTGATRRAGCAFDLAIELERGGPALGQPQHWVSAPSQAPGDSGASGNGFAAEVALIPVRSDFLASAQLQLQAYAKAVPPEQG